MAGQAFESHCSVNELGYAFIGVVDFLHLRVLFKRVFQSDVEAVGDEARHAVHIAVGHCEGASDIADRRLCAECSEGDYLGDVFSAVLVHNVVDDLFAAVILEVHVDVRHLLALDVEETLEDEAVRKRVDIGYAEAVEHEACCGAAAHGEEYVTLVHELGDVPDDEEVVGELGLSDDFKLIVETSAFGFACVWNAAVQRFVAYLREILVGADAAGHRVLRKAHAREVQVKLAHLGDAL